MEVDNVKTTPECFKLPCNILGNLNITCDNSRIVLWSKYELFILNQILRDPAVQLGIQFEIETVLVNKDCLLCLDCSGIMNLRTTKSSSICNKKNIKCVCACEIDKNQYVVSLQFERNRAKLLVNKFDINFDSQNELELNIPNEDWKDAEGGKSIMVVSGLIKPEHLKKLKNVFYVGQSDSNFLLVIISLDKKNVYAMLIPVTLPMEKFNGSEIHSPTLWLKLYTSPTEIVDIKITMINEISIFLGLAAGNIIKIPLLFRNQKPAVSHLNTAVNKFVIIEDTIIYTDGLTMWKYENMFSESDFTFEQFFVRNVRDFCLIQKQVYCVTYSNLIYSFNIGHRTAYITPPDTGDTCAAHLVTNSDYFQATMKMHQKIRELHEKIEKESKYFTAVTLSSREDIMDELIHVNASVFDDYRDLAQKYNDLTLTDELSAYYDPQSYYFLIQIAAVKVNHKLNQLLSDVLGDIKIHIMLFEQDVLKSTSLQIKEKLTRKNFVISLKRNNRNIKRVQVHIKIITNIPGKFDEKQRLWVILFRKCIVLHAENFINMKTSSNSILLKEDEMPLELLICKMTNHLHGTLYRYNISDNQRFEWTFFVKLPSNGMVISNILALTDHTDFKGTELFRKHMAMFSKDKNFLELPIGKERVNLNIEGDKLRVTCPDIIIALDIRNYFASMMFTCFKGKPSKEFIDHKMYTIIENLNRDIENIKRRRNSTEEFAILLTQFLWNVHCSIPI